MPNIFCLHKSMPCLDHWIHVLGFWVQFHWGNFKFFHSSKFVLFSFKKCIHTYAHICRVFSIIDWCPYFIISIYLSKLFFSFLNFYMNSERFFCLVLTHQFYFPIWKFHGLFHVSSFLLILTILCLFGRDTMSFLNPLGWLIVDSFTAMAFMVPWTFLLHFPASLPALRVDIWPL